MSVLFVVSTTKSQLVLSGLIEACKRRGQPFCCFVTGKGVSVLHDPDVAILLENAMRAVVCEYSWSRYFPDHLPPIEVGSQTDHSAMVGEADQVLSL